MSPWIDAIKEYQKGFRARAPKEVQELMLRATKKLEEARISKNALNVGDKVPEIKLPNAIGKEVSLEPLANSTKQPSQYLLNSIF